jgi:hypothetical protein
MLPSKMMEQYLHSGNLRAKLTPEPMAAELLGT